MELILARHGQTNFNVAKKFYGALDVPINENGRNQAELLADKLRDFEISKIVTSEMTRCVQTATPTAEEHKMKISQNGLFNEKSFGRWEGLDADQIEALDSKEWWSWLNAPFTYTPPAAEPFDTFFERVTKGVSELLIDRQTSNKVLLVCHLGVLRSVNQLLFPGTDFWSVDFKAGCYTQFHLDEDSVRVVTRNQ
ncbi:histidine phosphatase family protein [Furfurilactobacillus siliginis]|uniref:Alpha-ribazole phosphatase n=1 Tax=Furfurilactobacillus siliginis TaxID=348151 RepID=A0A0R2L379_9LACO|nr:histidine phosphatase family protein [Furfurilactobacillus siliginis]KRN96207.1 alpha-ribazole-5-phosphate phosphatase [Furfurilactobacillus siliginis]GEK27868.1 alpha-ribazole phosphatase [Furfurilactobacillus siliginis]